MNTQPGNILIDSCQYTPVYLVQDTGAIKGQSYILTQGNVEEAKPVTDNLKRFYENSGILENNLVVNNVANTSKPRILKKHDNSNVGNMKMTSILMPQSTFKNNNLRTQCFPVPVSPINNVILKPTVVSANVVNNTPKVEVDRKIVKLTDFPNTLKTPSERILPKIKPKEDPPALNQNHNKHTSVQLLKLGETYHSLNQLSEDQMKMVNQALKIFSNPAKTSSEPTYDPVTNTKFIYKVVSPRDLTVVGKNKLVIKKKANNDELKKSEVKKVEVRKDGPKKAEGRKEDAIKGDVKKEVKKEDNKKVEVKKEDIKKVQVKKADVKGMEVKKEDEKRIELKKEPKKEVLKPMPILPIMSLADGNIEQEPEPPAEIKVTRSGRKVKFPKQIIPEETPIKTKKKCISSSGIVSCAQCSLEFASLYRLQKHYENHPTHIPAKIHSNLFHCLLAIIKSGSEEDKTNIFIQQLEQLIEKLKSLLPCLLKKIDGCEGKSCVINEDIGRLFGMNPGKYNLNVDALTCVKDKDGNCRHKPPKTNQFGTDLNNPSPIWLSKNSEENKIENETEDCARINAVDKWPTANKRIWNCKQKSQDMNAKKMRLVAEKTEPFIELGIEDLVDFSTLIDQSAISLQPKSISLLDNLDVGNESSRQLCTEKEDNQELSSAEEPILQPVACPDAIQLPMVKEIPTNTVSNVQNKKSKGAHTQFHSAHFDIRSSPIKPSAAKFSTFQINPYKNGKYEVQIIRPLEFDDKPNDDIQDSCSSTHPDTTDCQSIFSNSDMNLLSPCKEPSIPHDLSFDKNWIIDTVSEKSNESFMKTNSLIELDLLHPEKEGYIDKLSLNTHNTASDQLTESQSSSVLNFLESLGNECLSYPETDIRNNSVENVDFQLDLFSFSNT